MDGAVALLAEGLRARPGHLDAVLRLADLLAANGRATEAEGRYAEALRLAPGRRRPWERRGRARLRAGREAEALADLKRALELEPQRPGLKERVRSLEPKREPYEAPYALDALALAKAPDDGAPDDDAVVLGEVQVTRVFSERARLDLAPGGGPDPDAARRRGAGAAAPSPTRPTARSVEVLRVRVVKPDGTTTDTWEESEASESEPWYRLYYDTRSQRASSSRGSRRATSSRSPGGSTTRRATTCSPTTSATSRQVDGPTPKRRFDYVLLAPASRAIHANAPAGVRRSERPLADGLGGAPLGRGGARAGRAGAADAARGWRSGATSTSPPSPRGTRSGGSTGGWSATSSA